MLQKVDVLCVERENLSNAGIGLNKTDLGYETLHIPQIGLGSPAFDVPVATVVEDIVSLQGLLGPG
jgi:hypothetical protein